MQEFLRDILFAVVTAACPVLTAYLVVLIRRLGDSAAANTESVRAKTYITEAAKAIADAVAAVNQTFVDGLKSEGKFDTEAQKEAAQRALAACLASISPAAKRFIEAAYGGIREYLVTRIEAEVRKQKNEIAALPAVGELVSTAETTVEKREE